MRVMHQVLKKIYQDYAILFPPAEYEEIQKISHELIQMGLAPLPGDYTDFLMLTNGLFWNGLEIFATTEQERNNSAFFHRGISQMQKILLSNPVLKKKIILAIAPEEYISYDISQREYQIIDRYSYTVFMKFPQFSDILYYYVKNIIEK